MKSFISVRSGRLVGSAWVRIALALVILLTGSLPLASVQAQANVPEQGTRTLFLPSLGSTGGTFEFTAGSVTGIEFSEADQQAAVDYWTRERIATALALDSLEDDGSPERDIHFGPASFGPASFGPYGFAEPLLPAADADEVARAFYAQDWEAMSEAPGGPIMAVEAPVEAAGTSQVYSAYTINTIAAMQTLFPHRTVGRLMFTTPSGTSFCTATALPNNTILTAAHCLYDTPSRNRYYTNVVFIPAFRNGQQPYGRFPAASCLVPTAWRNLSGSYAVNSWARHDVGVCRMNRNSAGRTLNAAVGSLGAEWNAPFIRHVHNMGYPFRDYRNILLASGAGAFLRTCVAETFQQTTETRGMGCSWGQGNSGAPWIRGYQPNVVTGFVTSVHSGGFAGTQNRYGPRLNSSNFLPLCRWAGIFSNC